MGDKEEMPEEDIELAESIRESVSEKTSQEESDEKIGGTEPEPESMPELPKEEKKFSKSSLLSSYSFSSEGLPVEVRVLKTRDFVPRYEITIPGIAEGTKL